MRGPLRRLYWVLRPSKNRRMFAYDRRLLVNEYLAEQEAVTGDLESAIARTGFSLGYPSWNLLGYPAAALPAGFDDAGLPIGVQLAGPARTEKRLLSLAGQYERAHPWAARRPTL